MARVRRGAAQEGRGLIYARIAAIALGALALGACGEPHDSFGGGSFAVPLRAGDDPCFDRAAADLRASTDLVLHEGLPHGMFERELCKSELETKSTEVRHGQLFYVAPIPITPADADALRATFCEAGNYYARDPDAMKLCGGFHADYALTWSSGAGEYELQVCFGCHEADLHTPTGLVALDLRHIDPVTGPAHDALHRFRAQRPAREW